MGDAIEQTLVERGKRYGDFLDHSRIAQALKQVMAESEGWEGLTPDKKERPENPIERRLPAFQRR